jgi:superfamily II DNA/RNA helicase
MYLVTAQPIERAGPQGRKNRRHARPAAVQPTRAAGPLPSFAALGVPAPLIDALAAQGISAPFPIQAAVLPDALGGTDILGRGRTGSGKTLGFSIPLAARLADGRSRAGHPRGLVLVPTRELASQVHDVLAPLARAVGLSVATVIGGVSQRPQVAALRSRADIVVACPGRLADLMEQGHCHLGDVEISVVDEADHMADLGFLPIVRRLLEATPADGQRLLFSATLDKAVDVLVRRFLTDPARHSVDPEATPAALVHHLLTIGATDRVAAVTALASGRNRTLAFTRTRRGAHRLARQLQMAGIPATELHADLSQRVRQQNLDAFSSGAVRVLVATDIAARGIHVDGIDLVIHADPPAEHKAYLHRSGRTARAGAAGIVVTLQSESQGREVRTLMNKAGIIPVAADVTPSSPIIRTIAGPPAELVAFVPPAGAGNSAATRSRGSSGTRSNASAGSKAASGGKARSGNRGPAGGKTAGGARSAARARGTARTSERTFVRDTEDGAGGERTFVRATRAPAAGHDQGRDQGNGGAVALSSGFRRSRSQRRRAAAGGHGPRRSAQ